MTAILDLIKNVKTASKQLPQISDEQRNSVLRTLSQELIKNTDSILQENAKDLSKMPKDDPRYDRLELTKNRIHSVAQDLFEVSSLPPPLNRILLDKKLPNGLHLQKISVPLGVIAVIYESRPNVTIDVFSLCFKSGNACILKGGKEAHHSNEILTKIIKHTLTFHNTPENTIYLMPSEREAVYDLLNATGLVDLCIPRGSQSLIDFVRSNAKIPVIETGAGIVHSYFDLTGDLTKGTAIIENAKTRRVSVCNALDTLIIHQQRLKDLPQLIEPLAKKNVEIFADPLSYNALSEHYPNSLLKKASPQHFGTEFLSYKMSIKTVSSVEEALNHISTYSSCHSEAIIAEDPIVIANFLNNVDAAAVYVNASTAFTDGGEFGMGAEIGISTQKNYTPEDPWDLKNLQATNTSSTAPVKLDPKY